MKNTGLLALLVPVLIGGCAIEPMKPEDKMITKDVVAPITYDYVVEGSSKADLFQRARDYFATSFGDSRSVIRVQDETEGLILGKAGAGWDISSPYIVLTCHSEYDVRFMAKEGKARLQLELQAGAPSYSKCSGWQYPSVSGYEKIKGDFKAFSESLGQALEGKGKSQAFRDF